MFPSETKQGPEAGTLAVSIVMPCLNEAATIERCVLAAMAFLKEAQIAGEVVVVDNGSTDGSAALAVGAGARVVSAPAQGYGNALRAGVAAAGGDFVVMGDADGTYDFSALGPMIARLEAGCDLVIGNRFLGGIAAGAMPPSHRYLGNPVLSFVGRAVTGLTCGDFHCGLRAARRDVLLGLGDLSPGMEYASEMLVLAAQQGRRVEQVPVTLGVAAPGRRSHLRSWPDGWRHLRLLGRHGWARLRPSLPGAAAAIGLSVLMLAALYAAIDAPAVARAFAAADGRLVVAGAAMEVPLTIVTAWRFQLLAPAAARVGLREAVRLTLLGASLNLLLPAKLGDLAKAAFIGERTEMRAETGVAVVVLEKVFGLAALLGWCALGLAFGPLGTPATGTGLPGPAAFAPAALAAVTLGLVAALAVAAGAFGLAPDGPGARNLEAWLGPRWTRLRDAWDELRRAPGTRSRWALAGVVSVAMWLGQLTQIYVFVLACGGATPFLTHLAWAAFSVLASMVPVGFAGVGPRDGAIVLLYAPTLGAAGAAAMGLMCALPYLLVAAWGAPYLLGAVGRKAGRR